MANTVAAENLAGRVEKEKIEKRRALGRGLESLLPGPRVVTPGQSGGAADKQQVSHFVRNDKAVAGSTDGSTSGAGGDFGTRTGVSAPHVPAPHRIDSIQAVVEESAAESKSPLLAEDARNGAPSAERERTMGWRKPTAEVLRCAQSL
jgi:hypothetical protein